METRTNLHFSPQWISADFNLPDPVAIANGVVFALSTGENAQQTGSTDEKRMQSTRPAVLYALDTRSGKVLYQSGSAITRVDWLFLMARFMPWTTIRKFTVLV